MNNTPLSSILLVVFASFIGSFGGVFLKAGADRLERRWSSLLFNWRIAAGVLAFLVSSVFFVIALRNGELSVLYPIVSFGYVWTLLWSRLFFHERLTGNKILGLLLIMAGITMLGLGSR